MTRILLIAVSVIGYVLVAAYAFALVVTAVIFLTACGGHGQDNKQGTSVVDQPKEQTK